MRTFYNNLADGATVTGSSEQALLPATNVQNEAISLVWRTGTSTALESLVFDFGSAVPLTSAIIAGHNLTSGDSLIKVQGHTADSWGSPDFSQTFTYSANNMLATFSSTSKRYWRITFTKASSGVTRDIGRIFLGTYFTPSEDPHYTGYDDSKVDNSVSQKSRGGQTYSDIRDQYDAFSMEWKALNNADTETFRTIHASLGSHTSLFVQPATSTLTRVYYCKFSGKLKRTVAGFDSDLTWDLGIDFEEQL